MAKKEFTYRGKTIDELKKMSLTEFAELVTSAERRFIKRGIKEQEKKLLEILKETNDPVKTHCRDMVILPEMVGKALKVYNGKEFQDLLVTEEMLGHRLGEFALTRKRVTHSAAGIGATKSSAAMSVK